MSITVVHEFIKLVSLLQYCRVALNLRRLHDVFDAIVEQLDDCLYISEWKTVISILFFRLQIDSIPMLR